LRYIASHDVAGAGRREAGGGLVLPGHTGPGNRLEFDLHPKLLRALQDLGFVQPTPIQQECLQPAVKGRCDIIGAAETGSGKTLAFGLPILQRLLTQADAVGPVRHWEEHVIPRI